MTVANERLVELNLDPNEASGLVRISDSDLLDRYGWDRGFWCVLDEVDASECGVLLGHASEAALDDGWSSQRLRAHRRGHSAPVEDAEAVAAWDGFVYMLGSHHGHKSGPIRPDVQWVARFEESAVEGEAGQDPKVTLDVVHTQMLLHRFLNDALRDSGVDLLPMTDDMAAAFIDATIDELRNTPLEGRVRKGDWTVNIEGADFTSGGDLLLGLRFPIAADGMPLVVQLSNWQGLFAQPLELPTPTAVWQVDAIGKNGSLAGVRDLCVVEDTLHLVTGDLDSAGKGSIIREEYDGGTSTMSTHFTTPLKGRDGGRLGATFVREFPDQPRIEGIAADAGGRFYYVSDEDDFVALRSTPLLIG